MEAGHSWSHLPWLPPVLCMSWFLRKATTHSKCDWAVGHLQTGPFTFSCLGCTIYLHLAYMQLGSLGIIFIQIVLPSPFLTSPTLFVSPGNVINNHLISSRPVSQMSLRTGQEEDFCKTSLGKCPFNNESLFIFHCILRLNTSLFFTSSMCLLRVFCHCSFFVRKCMVNQVFCGSIYYVYAVILISHLCKFLKISHWVCQAYFS